MAEKITQHFLKGLTALTKERDTFELEFTLIQALNDLLVSIGNQVESIKVYRLREISQLFFAVISAGKVLDKNSAPNMCQKLLDCYNTGEYCVYESEGSLPVHMFPLRNDIVHQNAVVAIQSDIGRQDVKEGICAFLDVYQNYLGLLNDNERDTLTGLLNRKTFDNRINKVLSQILQQKMRNDGRVVEAYFLAIFDIDHFKKVNDQYGHLIGDEVLLLFSQLMTKTFRETDPLFRFGGEEFVAIFGCANDSDIVHVLERFTKKLQEFSFPQVGKVTVSIGCIKLTVDATPTQLVDRADLALYYAKNNGRNRTCYYEKLIAEGLIQDDVKEGDIELF